MKEALVRCYKLWSNTACSSHEGSASRHRERSPAAVAIAIDGAPPRDL
jgi:hypothetical protein